MRLAARFVLAAVLVIGPAASSAWAVTVKELLDYKGRLSDDILIALIESDGSVFHLTAADVVSLLDQGLSERVVTAMLRTSTPVRAARPLAPAPEPEAALAAAPAADVPAQSVVETPPAPVVVNVTQTVTQQVEERPSVRTVEVPVAVPVFVPVVSAHERRPEPAPVYWGFGGARRPDTWQDNRSRQEPPKKSGSGTGGRQR